MVSHVPESKPYDNQRFMHRLNTCIRGPTHCQQKIKARMSNREKLQTGSLIYQITSEGRDVQPPL